MIFLLTKCIYTIAAFSLSIKPCDSFAATSLHNVMIGGATTTAAGDTASRKTTNLIFPGGGIFFYWQAGCISYLREKNYSLLGDCDDDDDDDDDDGGGDNAVKFIGASAGALCATLAVTGVDFEQATELALSKSDDAGIWDRPLGLFGIWGDIIEVWLDELIPDDSVKMLENDRLSLLVTEVPSFQRRKISQFESKKDLIRCNMASVHIPLFLDGKLTTNFRSKSAIDGSFRASEEDYFKLVQNGIKNDDSSNIIYFDWKKDPILSDRTLTDAVSVISKEGIWALLEQGRSYAATMEKRGDFDSLLRKQ